MTKLERHLRNEVQRTERQSFDYSTKDQADEAADAREMLKEYLEIRASHETWSEVQQLIADALIAATAGIRRRSM